MSKKSYTIIDFYKAYNTEFSDNIDYKTYRSILIDYFKSITEGLLTKSKKYTLPWGLGNVWIGKRKPKHYNGKSLSIDFKLTKELGKTVYHLNEHSNGYKCQLFWSKLGLSDRNSYWYGLVLTRANKRKLAQIIKNKLTDFPEI